MTRTFDQDGQPAEHFEGSDVGPPLPELRTIGPGDIRRMLADAAVAVINGEMSVDEAKRITRDCRRITRDLNQRGAAAIQAARLSADFGKRR